MQVQKVLFFICLFFGWLGAHRFLEKKVLSGAVYLFTFGFFFFGWAFDIIRLFRAAYMTPEQVEARRERREARMAVRRAEAEARKAEAEARKAEALASQQGATYAVQPAPPEPAPADNLARCPKCYSTSLTANKKGYGLGKGVVGLAVAGPVGLLAGGLGKNKIKVTCLNCGHRFKPGAR